MQRLARRDALLVPLAARERLAVDEALYDGGAVDEGEGFRAEALPRDEVDVLAELLAHAVMVVLAQVKAVDDGERDE